MKLFHSIILFLIITASALSAKSSPRELLIAMDDWPPLSYNEDGVIKGISADVISRVMDRLGIPVKIELYPFTRALMLAANGKVDALAPISYQPFREDILYFTDEQREFISKGNLPDHQLWNGEYRFFIHRRQVSSFRFKGYDDPSLKDYSIGVVNGYSYTKEFREADLNRKTYPSPDAAFKALAEGEIDLFPMGVTVGTWLIKKLGLSDKVKYLDNTLFSKPYHIAFTRKSDHPGIKDLSDRFQEELSKMRASGEYDSIYDSYIHPEYVNNITRPLTFVCEEWVPWEYIEDGKVVGVDAAIVDYIMGRIGIPYKIEIYPWSRAWMMAEKGKADAVLSISYQASREEILLYTEDQRQFAKTGAIPENYLWMSEYVFFVMNQNRKSSKFESYSQLKEDGVRIGRNRDYSYCPEFMETNFEGPFYSKTEDGLLALVAGEIDLYPMDKTIGLAYLKRLGLADSVTWLEKPLFSKPYLSPFCRKSNLPDLDKVMKAFYRELRIMRSNGTYDRLYSDSLKAINKSE